MHPRHPRRDPGLLPQSERHGPRSSRPPAAGRGAQAQTAAAGLDSGDRFFWITLRRFWSRWADFLVKPETVIGWHRTGFRLYWR
jgi:hypothetical protein